MAKKKKQGLFDKVLHGEDPVDSDHELEGDDDQTEEHEQAESSPSLPAEDKHHHKKFDKFKKGN